MVYEKLVRIIAGRTGKPESVFKPETDLRGDLGLDSLDMFQIIGDIEDAFGIEVDDSADVSTVSEAADYIERKME
jgi:acyl carrier protein